MTELVILVDQDDRAIGTADKMTAHQQGLLHRAFSIFIVNHKGELLLQQRAYHKYHSGGLWTNTCCSHPRPHETVLTAANRRLYEEMGIRCPLQELFTFIYKAELDNGLIEHELDHVLVGQTSQTPQPNPEEVAQWQWIDHQVLADDLIANPHQYTYWLRSCFVDYWHKVAGVLPNLR
ncbi:MAG: isopentenyl-diphosphate Delta-isomerase [Pseudanabaenaceae cyanobacterium]